MVAAVIDRFDDEIPILVLELDPVSVNKLSHNHLPAHWQNLISSGWSNAHLVAQYLDRHQDPLVGEKLATHLNDRYLYLQSQGLTAASIMNSLYEFITGKGEANVQRQVAAHALLAHFFESCDIFENAPLEAKQ